MQYLNKPVAAICLAVASAFVQAQEATYDFNIPAQSASQVLNALSKQTGLQPFFAEDSVKGVQSPGVKGKFSLREALGNALAGTGLSYQFTAEKAVAISTSKPHELGAIVIRDSALSGYHVPNVKSATRSNVPVEQIPQSIISIPRKLIDDQDAKFLGDVVGNVSAVSGYDQRDVSTISGFMIRGFSAGITVDGVTVPGYFANQEPVSNIEQVDVIKGPVGSLYGGSQSVGANNIGGTVAITSKAPEKSARREVGMRIGSYGDRAINFDLNQPLGDEFGFRVVGELQGNDSETDRVTAKRTFIAPSFSWHPDSDKRLVVRLRHAEYEYLNSYGLPVGGTLLPGNGVNVPVGASIPRERIFTAEGMPKSTVVLDGINIQWDQQLNDVWSWNFTFAQNRAEIDSRNLYPWTLTTVSPTRMWSEITSTVVSPSVTAKFDTAGIKHTVVAGLEYDETRDDGFIKTATPSVTPNYINPLYPNWVEPTAPGKPDQQNRYQTKAIFLQDQLSLGNFHLQAGLRHAEVEVEDVNKPWGINNNTKNSKTSPRFGAVYEFTPQFSAFAGYGEGFKVPIAGTYAQPPKPEESKQTEVGFRLKNLYGIHATLAWFDLTRINVPAYGGAATGFKSVQIGKQNSQGIDLDLTWQATPELSWIASYSKIHAKVVESTAYYQSIVGKELFRVPDTTARIAMRYDFRSGDLAGLGLGIGARYHSAMPGNNTNSYYTPSATLFDAQASYLLGKARLALSINNLADKKYWIPATANGDRVYAAPRRTISFSANYAF